MEQFFAELLERTTEVPVIWGYTLVFFIAWLENVFPPIPGDVLVVFAGYLAAIGPMAIFPVIAFSTLGGILGFMCMYYIGRYGGPRLLESRALRWLPSESVSRVQNWLQTWGYTVVAANRFLSGARTVIAFTVGMNRMPALPVGLLASLSAAVWVTLIAVLGYVVGDEWERVVDYLARYGRVISVLIFLFLVWQLYKAIRRIRQKG
ncbi:MAG: DedA family protein [Bacteroidetes bacterium]|nr:DedA family protein [Bacteroidota bacterium]